MARGIPILVCKWLEQSQLPLIFDLDETLVHTYCEKKHAKVTKDRCGVLIVCGGPSLKLHLRPMGHPVASTMLTLPHARAHREELKS